MLPNASPKAINSPEGENSIEVRYPDKDACKKQVFI
jgi:hypothetical protein